jgi:hypothetical protein
MWQRPRHEAANPRCVRPGAAAVSPAVVRLAGYDQAVAGVVRLARYDQAVAGVDFLLPE